ncbi:hypothetical protein IT568_07575 [bacterium]|nr:hypothetical protein [bacterium]
MRKIVRSELFNEELKELIKNPDRAAEFVKGAEWILSREPESGARKNENSKVFFRTFSGRIFKPPIFLECLAKIFYTFDEKNVYLLSIRNL